MRLDTKFELILSNWLITIRRSSACTSYTSNYATCSAMSSKRESGLCYKLVHHITYTQHTHSTHTHQHLRAIKLHTISLSAYNTSYSRGKVKQGCKKFKLRHFNKNDYRNTDLGEWLPNQIAEEQLLSQFMLTLIIAPSK